MNQPLWCRAGACVGASTPRELHKAGLREHFAQDISQVLVRLCQGSTSPGCSPMPSPHPDIKATAPSASSYLFPALVPQSILRMALHMVLVMLSLLPLLVAQNPEHANITIGEPITNETLSWLSGKWFFIGAAVLNPDYQRAIQKTQTVFFYLTPNLINDTMELREYHTIGDQCVYNSTHLGIQRENGTLSKYVGGVETIAHLIVLKKHEAFMLAFDLKDEKKRGLSLNAKKPDITPELREVFQKAVKHVGMNESEIILVDWKKDRCYQQEKKQLELEKETKKDP